MILETLRRCAVHANVVVRSVLAFELGGLEAAAVDPAVRALAAELITNSEGSGGLSSDHTAIVLSRLRNGQQVARVSCKNEEAFAL